jgi:hypothetical protein
MGGIYTPLTPISILLNTGTPPIPTGSVPLPTSAAPQVTCTAIANILDTAVTLWTNYVTDNGAALEAQESNDCPGLANWSVTNIQTAFTAPDGSTWFANQMFQFTLAITHPQELICINKAIAASGGPSNTVDCPFAPAISPP